MHDAYFDCKSIYLEKLSFYAQRLAVGMHDKLRTRVECEWLQTNGLSSGEGTGGGGQWGQPAPPPQLDTLVATLPTSSEMAVFATCCRILKLKHR